MVAIAEPFRAHWEANDEFRRIAESEERAEWLLWFLNAKSSAYASTATYDNVRDPEP
jgi:hypothetical protein